MSITFHESSLRLATIVLRPGDRYACEPGAIIMMQDLVRMTAYLGGLSDNKVANALKSPWNLIKRKISGERAAMAVLESQAVGAQSEKKIVIGPPELGTLESINCERSGGVICKRGAFVAAKMPVDVSFKVLAKAGVGFFGPGFVFQHITSISDVILWAPGPVMRVRLGGDSIHVDPKCLLAYTPDVECSAEFTGVKNAIFSNEGVVMLKLEGNGHVWFSGASPEPLNQSQVQTKS